MSCRAKILIIDDEPDTIKFLTAWLEDQGFDTCAAMDGRLGMQTLLEEQPDLILMDIRMPERTGSQLYRELKLNNVIRDIPVIIVTGLPQFEIFAHNCSRLPQPSVWIEKPINLSELLTAIRATVKRGGPPGREP